MPLREAGAIFAGGAAGAVLRALLAEWLDAGGGDWPWGTLVANVAGAFVLGLVVARLPPSRHALLGGGFCGALTTFSTLELELLWMLDAGRTGLAAAYALVSVAAGIAAVAIGRRR